MYNSTKSNHKLSKGARLNWVSVKELKKVTVEKLNIKGVKVFSNASVGKMASCNNDSKNLLIPQFLDFNHNGYELKFIQKKSIKDDSDHLFSYIYKFYSPITKLNYVVIADLHDHDFFAIKFYPKCYKKTDKKYSLITNKGDLGNILITCINIIPTLLREKPKASFGFVGARTIDKKSNTVEQIENTQRFNIYAYLAKRKVGNVTFQHFEYPEISGYMFINRSGDHDIEYLENCIRFMLSVTYNNLPMP